MRLIALQLPGGREGTVPQVQPLRPQAGRSVYRDLCAQPADGLYRVLARYGPRELLAQRHDFLTATHRLRAVVIGQPLPAVGLSHRARGERRLRDDLVAQERRIVA